MPELDVQLDGRDESIVELQFEMYTPEIDSTPMKLDDLLRYLEYCVPW